MRNKRGAANGNWIPVAFLAVAVIFLGQTMGWWSFLGATTAGPGGAPGGQITVNVTGQQCGVDTTSLTLGPVEDYYSGAKLNFLYHRWYTNAGGTSNWVDQGYVSDGTVKSVAPGQQVAVYYNLNGSATTYYPRYATFTVPCSGAFASSNAPGANFKDAYRLGNMSTAANLNLIVQNIDTTNNKAGTPQKILAGQVRQLGFEVDFPNKQVFGSPFELGQAGIASTTGQSVQSTVTPPAGGNTLMECFYNSTLINQLQLASGKPTYSGTFPLHNPITPANGNAVTGWLFPGQASNAALKDKLIVTADPSNPASSTQENVNCTFVDSAWYLPTNSNYPSFGFENDKQADVGSNDFSIIFYLNGTG